MERHESPDLESPEQVRGALRLLDALEKTGVISADDASMWRVSIASRAIFRRFHRPAPGPRRSKLKAG